MRNSEPARPRRLGDAAGIPEAELVRRAQLGSVAAFERLVDLRGAALHRYLRLELRHEPDALDALQETLTAAWRGLPRLRDAERFWPWLVGIATHKATDALRRRTRSTAGDPSSDAVAPNGSALLEAREALAALSPDFRQVLLLRFVVGLSEGETAAALGVRVGTVKSRTNRARRALEELLA